MLKNYELLKFRFSHSVFGQEASNERERERERRGKSSALIFGFNGMVYFLFFPVERANCSTLSTKIETKKKTPIRPAKKTNTHRISNGTFLWIRTPALHLQINAMQCNAMHSNRSSDRNRWITVSKSNAAIIYGDHFIRIYEICSRCFLRCYLCRFARGHIWRCCHVGWCACVRLCTSSLIWLCLCVVVFMSTLWWVKLQ